MTSEKQELKYGEVSGVVFVGCLLLGLAASFITGNFVSGMLGGLGLGFVGMAIAMVNGKDDQVKNGVSGLVFIGFLTIGLAIGLFLDSVAVGIFSGLGVGFIGMAITRHLTGVW